MTLDEQLRTSLHSSYAAWEPEAPDALPRPRRSTAPLVAGVAGVALAGTGLAAALATSGGHHGTTRPGAGATTIDPCGPDDVRVDVTVGQSTYIAGEIMFSEASLVPTTDRPCRVYEESSQDAFVSAAGVTRVGSSDCYLGNARRVNATGAAPSAEVDGPWCADEHHGVAPEPFPALTDDGVVLDPHGTVASSSIEEALGATGASTPPSYARLQVASGGAGSGIGPGTWRATETYGPWSGQSAPFTVTAP